MYLILNGKDQNGYLKDTALYSLLTLKEHT